MATADPRATLAEALGALGETLRHHRDLGLTELSLAGDYLLDPAAALRAQEKALQGCRKCKLCEGRSTVVFGSGNPRAEFVVIGEGPGADEDAQGLPFVGRAGQLLTKMLEARKVELSRDDVYITNAVKCLISPRVLIYSADGFKPIKDIRVGDLVLTHRGRFRRVVYVRPHDVLPRGSEVIRLSILPVDRAGKRVHITVTPEHPFLVNGSWKSASEIRPSDSVSALGDTCEVCGRPYFVRYDRYEARSYHTCSARCHNKRIFHSSEAREKVRRTMKAQYLDGRRDAAGIRKGVTGFGEAEVKPILDRLGVNYIHLFALPESPFLYDFCLPDQRILIEVRGPGFNNVAAQERAAIKDRLANDHGYLLVNLWWAQVIDQPTTVEEILRRILRNHGHEYVFVEARVVSVESRRTRAHFRLYNIGVEEDESYVAAGVVSHNCRPPGNRNPEAEELSACAPFLAAQLAVLQPKVVLALGSVASQSLLGTREPIGKLRGRVHPYGSAVLIPTFHPAFLLRNPGDEYKRMAWEDLQLARREYDRRRTR